MVIDALKVTGVPEQILFTDSDIETAGVTGVFTTIFVPLLFAELVVTQLLFDVNVQVTELPVTKLLFVNVLLFVPALIPFFFH